MAGCPPNLPGGVDWPGILADIAEEAGPMAAWRVAEAKGGVPAYIPHPAQLSEEHWLVRLCGLEAARRIARRMGGARYEVPLGPCSGNRAAVARIIREALASGASRRVAARRAGVARRTVQRHANETDDQYRLL